MPPEGVTSYRTPCGSVASDGSPPKAPTLVSDQRWWLPDAVAPGDAVSSTVPSTATPDSRAGRTDTRRDIGRLPPLWRLYGPRSTPPGRRQRGPSASRRQSLSATAHENRARRPQRAPVSAGALADYLLAAIRQGVWSPVSFLLYRRWRHRSSIRNATRHTSRTVHRRSPGAPRPPPR